MDIVNEKAATQDSSPEAGVLEFHKEPNRKEKRGLIIWRCVNGMMMLFFLMAAGVQFNDPDPWLWVPLYGTASVLTGCIVVRPSMSGEKIWLYTYFIHAVYCVAMFIYVCVDLFIAFKNPESDGTLNPLTYEEGRELAGILITTVWLLICKQSPIIRCSVPKFRLSCCKKNKGELLIEASRVTVDRGHSSPLPPLA